MIFWRPSKGRWTHSVYGRGDVFWLMGWASSRKVNPGGPMKKIKKELLFTILLTLLILVILYLIYFLGWKPLKFVYEEF